MPIGPFMAVSYTAGLTGVRPAPYTAGTVVGLVPGSIVYVAIGSSTALVDWSTPSVTSAFMVLARGFHGRAARPGVDQLKSAPDQQGSVLSRDLSALFEEHLPGEEA